MEGKESVLPRVSAPSQCVRAPNSQVCPINRLKKTQKSSRESPHVQGAQIQTGLPLCPARVCVCVYYTLTTRSCVCGCVCVCFIYIYIYIRQPVFLDQARLVNPGSTFHKEVKQNKHLHFAGAEYLVNEQDEKHVCVRQT